MSKIRVDFSKMPPYTRSDRYLLRRLDRAESNPRDYDAEEIKEYNELYGLDGWGEDPGFWDSLGDS